MKKFEYTQVMRNNYKAWREAGLMNLWGVRKTEAVGSMEFAKILMQEAEVAVAPGIGFGEYGEGFVRIGLVENEHRIKQAAKNVKKLISG